MKKLYVVGGAVHYTNWLIPLGFELVDNAKKADVFMFTGGEDVSPEVYGHENICSGNNLERDIAEIRFFVYAKNNKIPMIGVCRGSQFLGAMSGAKLIQDMYHPHYHHVTTFDGQNFTANSTHHQAVFIPENMVKGVDYELLAWADNISGKYTFADKSVKFPKGYKETECTWWAKTQCLGIQSHPEDTLGTPWNAWLQSIVQKYIL